jgi:predicted nucleotide-binding protein
MSADTDLELHYADSLQKQVILLESFVDLLETEIQISSDANIPSTPTFSPDSKTVFVVHGHNDTAKESTARLIQKLGLNPVILHEQPNQGRTVIEKFTDYSNVGFAVVLMTGDDKGGTSTTETDKLQPRARQNVILELGFFLGKLGRKHVCALYERGVEIPSDYQGVLFVPLDPGGIWKLQLAKEMKAAGLNVDLNQI